MSEIQRPKRLPAINCWIKYIMSGRYSSKDKLLFSVLGKIETVRLVSTVINKKEFLSRQKNEENEISSDNFEHLNLRFDLDDGTGIISAVWWQVNPDKFNEYVIGDIVDIIGPIRENKGYLSINIKFIRKIGNPNYVLLRDAEIIKKIKIYGLKDIPEKVDTDFTLDVISDSANENDWIPKENSNNFNEIKEKIYSIIETSTQDGNGISYEDLKKTMQISDALLKNYILDLEIESRIYQAEENIYQSY